MLRFASPRLSNDSSSRRLVMFFRGLLRPSAFFGTLFLAAVVAGGMATRSMVAPLPVFAACHSANGTCTPADKTAVADVAYYIPGSPSVTPVEPNSTTAWTITAYWGQAAGLGVNCDDVTEQATVDVTWNGSTWSTANFNSAGANVKAAAVCALLTCGSHSSSYRLYVNVNDPIMGGVYNLRQVVFVVNTVPNATDFDGSCNAGSSHSPTASSFSGTDSGGFECAFDCNQTGTNVNITYN